MNRRRLLELVMVVSITSFTTQGCSKGGGLSDSRVQAEGTGPSPVPDLSQPASERRGDAEKLTGCWALGGKCDPGCASASAKLLPTYQTACAKTCHPSEYFYQLSGACSKDGSGRCFKPGSAIVTKSICPEATLFAYGNSACSGAGNAWCVDGVDYSRGKSCGSLADLTYPALECYWLPTGGTVGIRRNVFLLLSSAATPQRETYQKMLSHELRNTIAEVSHGYVDYAIVETRSANYTTSSQAYATIINDLALGPRIASGEIHEIWTWDTETDEYAMKIPGDHPKKHNAACSLPAAYWFYRPYNLPDLGRTVWWFGFNSTRGLGEMLEDYGHRVEGILSIYIADCSWGGTDDWSRFTTTNKQKPGQARCGNVHYGPNSTVDYEWASETKVPSTCNSWSSYPNVTEVVEQVSCSLWGCDTAPGAMINHHRWWLSSLPHASGIKNGRLNNWWRYIVDTDRAIAESSF